MCDYSLHGLPNRLAVEGEPLAVHQFPTGTLGLVSPLDVQALTAKSQEQARAGFWSLVRRWFSTEESPPAVCIPPGARLLLRELPQPLQQKLGVGEEEEVTFIQQDVPAYAHRDAVRFGNGQEILLQKLAVGQQVDVLCLAPSEVAPGPSPFVAAFSEGT